MCVGLGNMGVRQTVAVRRSAVRSARTACVGAAWRGRLREEGVVCLSGGDFSFRMTHPVSTQPVPDGALRLAESTWLVGFHFHCDVDADSRIL